MQSDFRPETYGRKHRPSLSTCIHFMYFLEGIHENEPLSSLYSSKYLSVIKFVVVILQKIAINLRATAVHSVCEKIKIKFLLHSHLVFKDYVYTTGLKVLPFCILVVHIRSSPIQSTWCFHIVLTQLYFRPSTSTVFLYTSVFLRFKIAASVFFYLHHFRTFKICILEIKFDFVFLIRINIRQANYISSLAAVRMKYCCALFHL